MKKLMTYMLCFVFLCSLCGCTAGDSQEVEKGYKIYYTNIDENNVVYDSYRAKSKNTDEMIEEFLKRLEKSSDATEYRVSKPEEVELLEYHLNDKTLSLKFSPEYDTMHNTVEVLMRTAYVKTLIQIPGVDFVDFYVGEMPLEDSNGRKIGAMNEETFVDSSGGQINEYDEADLILYYANEDGTALKQTMKSIVYDQNIALEKVVIDQLIKGPSEGKGIYPTVPSKTKLVNISVKDSICYVNFDEEFMKLDNDVSAEVQIYSVVNSLAELTTVSKVQISINGVTDRNFVEGISFNTIFERNLDIIETDKEDDMVD